MGNLIVESIGINELLKRIRTNAWLIPTFQRDFVWTEADVTSLVLSVVDARPIGMATLWEQPDDSGLELEPVSIPDTKAGVSDNIYLSASLSRPKKYYAILDGRQRCTALAMAFGGLRPSDTRRRFSGRWFLDAKAQDPTARVLYMRENDVKKQGLDHLPTCVAKGLFPLAAAGDDVLGQWLNYLQGIMDPNNYPDGQLPAAEELSKRNSVLRAAFDGINATLLAVYVVPDDYGLGEICEIFETLNTTGTRVSTVDLLHSWLYSDTSNQSNPINLREWIDELGQTNGAEGWASRADRPELIAQAATAAYALMDSEKAPPRAVGRRSAVSVTSLRAGDLLATPAEFWQDFTQKTSAIADYYDGFQSAVAGARFPYQRCPYPVTSAMYIGLRWYMDHDSRYSDQWSTTELNSLFRAFFWRNALLGRYDQGFLTQSATDMRMLRDTLFRRANADSASAWATEAANKLDSLGLRTPDRKHLIDRLTDARPAGALGAALGLPIWTKPTQDLLHPSAALSYPDASGIELHHLYPREWCRSNKHGALAGVLDPDRVGRDYARSISNLTPLTSESNKEWRAKQPGVALEDARITYENSESRLESHYIDRVAYSALTADTAEPQAFWQRRAELIADDLLMRCGVHL